jgi:hypothetical protein
LTCSEQLHQDDVTVVISNKPPNGDVVQMVHGHFVMPVVYVSPPLCKNVPNIDYAKVTKRKDRERHSSPGSNSLSELTNGQPHHQEDRQ